jgi:uncharacterized protein YceK
MKQLMLAVIICILLSGCAEFIDVANIMLGYETLHEGTVERVEVSDKNTTTIHFEDGWSYQVDDARYARPGKSVKVLRDPDGSIVVE